MAGCGCIFGGMFLASIVYICLFTGGADTSAWENSSMGLQALSLLVGLVAVAIFVIIKSSRKNTPKPPATHK